MQNLHVTIVSVPQAREKPARGGYAQEGLFLCLRAHRGPQSIRTRKDHSLVVDSGEEGEKGKEKSFAVYLAARSAQKRRTPPPGMSPPFSVPEDNRTLNCTPWSAVGCCKGSGWLAQGAAARRVTHPFAFVIALCGFPLP